MRVLMSGSTGFIGTEVARRLRERGDVVVPVTRRPGAPGEVGIDLENGRLDCSRLPGGTLEGITASLHLAGAPIVGRWTSGRREQVRASRIALGEVMARSLAALERPPEVHVSGSAVGFYGDRGEQTLDESSPSGSGFLPSLCRAWEEASAPAARAGVRTVCLRTGIVLGRGGILKAEAPLFRLGLGARLGSGRQWTSWISLEDEVRAILWALDSPQVSGPLNLCAPLPVRNAEFTARLAAAVSRPAPFSVPAPALRLALGSGPADEMLLASQRVLPARLSEAGFSFVHADLDAALGAALSKKAQS